MKYKIVQSHVIFNEDNTLNEVAVLWRDGDSFRATYAATEQKAGYGNIKPNDALTVDLFQRVAGFGVYLDEKRKKNYFPNIKNWSR